ncbi:phosphatidate cytidylyltransferase [Mycoplasma simbae]|uniref:phosphatidate cytidylyltransferase n=1 Tax=Mycoplasma simbae TaxID=36744 RepID=UPI0006915624|nr:phosphatidate cytidylyltransferase [Mycoplasma simbae]
MKKTLYKRIIPAVIFAIIMLGSLIPLSIYSHESQISRIFSFIFIWALAIISFYEFFKAQRLRWYWAITLALLYCLATIFPVEEITIPWLTKAGKVSNPNLADTVNFGADWQITKYALLLASDPYIIVLSKSIAIAFGIIELFTRTATRLIDRLARILLCCISIYILCIFAKIYHGFIVYQGMWKYWLTIILVASFADTFGYVFGSAFGKKWIIAPFTPNISPKKTWEGFIGSIIMGSAIALTLVFSLDLFNNIALKILFSFTAPFIAVVGDLYFSYIKRINGIKDYSKLLKGHGGLLDRLDSISFLCVLAYLFLIINNLFI